MRKLFDSKVFKNKFGQVYSGWIIFFVMAAYYVITYIISDLFIFILSQILIAGGEINLSTGYYGAIVGYLNDVIIPIIMQILACMIMIAIPVITWRYIMKQSIAKMGLNSFKAGHKGCFIGVLMGAINCTLIFAILILTGQAKIKSWMPKLTILQICWVFVLFLVAFGEEIMNRSFFMSVLKRVGNIYVIIFFPSIIFGLIHLLNPNITVFSVLNIVLAGILFSYMFIKSGNIWMCIGYHFAWNTFQGIVYGMPVSGLNIKGMLTTNFTADNILNGGKFGIEGGILTTLVTILSFVVVRYYYRNSEYDFLSKK